MKLKRIAAITGALALVAVLGVFAATAAFAQTATPGAQSTPAAPTTQGALPGGWDGGPGFFGGSWTVFDAEAKALNLTPAQLFEQLHGGKTLTEIAQAQNVDIATVQAAAQAVQTQAQKDNIAQAVKDGTITQAQADWLLQGIANGYIGGGRGHGFDFGMGGGHGRHGGFDLGQPGTAAPSTTATPAPGTTG